MLSVCIDGRTIHAKCDGIGCYGFNLIHHIIQSKNGIHLNLLVKNHSKDDRLWPDPASFNTIRTTIDYRNRFLRDIWENSILSHTLNKNSIDVFHSINFHLPYLRKRHRNKIKTIVTIHDLVVFKLSEIYPRSYSTYWKFIIAQSVARADQIIAISESTKADLIDLLHVDEEKIRVIYHGVNHHMFQKHSTEHQEEKLLQKYNLKAPYILTLGLSDERKNGLRIIDGFHQLLQNVSDKSIKLAIGGQTRKSNQAILNRIKAYRLEEHIVLTGYIDPKDLPVIYRNALLFLYPSLYEGFGLPIIEAMACGTPVITSNISSMPEISGKAAILVNPYNTEELQHAMDRLIHDTQLAQTLIKLGLQQSCSFSWCRCAEQTLAVYREMQAGAGA